MRQAGRSEGIDFAFERIGRTPNTLDSHRLIRLAAGYAMNKMDASLQGNPRTLALMAALYSSL